LLSCSDVLIIIDFTRYPFDKDLLIIQDNSRVEELLYEIGNLNKTYNDILSLKNRINRSIEKLNNEITQLNNEVKTAIDYKNRIALETEDVKKNLTRLNSEFNEMKLLTDNKVILSSLQFVLIIICFVILLLYFTFFTLEKLRSVG
jgi:tRNA U34 5-carboxymethylaminomethyl modifying GTPase MnmE/TrmE